MNSGRPAGRPARVSTRRHDKGARESTALPIVPAATRCSRLRPARCRRASRRAP